MLNYFSTFRDYARHVVKKGENVLLRVRVMPKLCAELEAFT